MGEQDVGDLEKIRLGIEGWLQTRFVDRPGLSVADLNFPQASGESSVTLILEVRWPGSANRSAGEERFVFRMAPRESQVFENHDLQMQYDMMLVMAKEGVPAPELVGYEPDKSIVGSDFYVMAFCEGRIPSDNPPMMLGGWLKDEATPDERASMWAGGIEAIAQIHQIDLGAHDFSRLPQPAPGEGLLAQELRTFDSMFKPELRAAADPAIVEGWNYLMKSAPQDGEKALCWGDSRVGNLIFRDAKLVAVIDWEMANLGDPRTDLAWWIWIDRCNSEGLGAERLAGLPDPQDVYARWSELTGRSIQGIEWFELFAVVRFAIILERKFTAMREAHPDLNVPNFPAQFIPGLLERAQASGT
ncbi:MAG: phosphotransferase family protein [Myxococcota bacterium]